MLLQASASNAGDASGDNVGVEEAHAALQGVSNVKSGSECIFCILLPLLGALGAMRGPPNQHVSVSQPLGVDQVQDLRPELQDLSSGVQCFGQ